MQRGAISYVIHAILAFVVELGAIAGYGLYGWTKFDGPARYVAVAMLVAGAIWLWARHAAPAARNRLTGRRLLMFKIAFFALGIAAFALSGAIYVANLYACVAVSHILVALRMRML